MYCSKGANNDMQVAFGDVVWCDKVCLQLCLPACMMHPDVMLHGYMSDVYLWMIYPVCACP